MRFSFSHLVALIGVCAMTACCSTPKTTPLLGNPENPYPLTAAPKVGEIVHVPTGTVIDREQMIRLAADARVVYVGETHDNPGSHRLELDLLKGLAERHPGALALGMEMFSRSQQPVLDRWVAGELDEKSFLKESHWFDQWKMDFDYYRDLLQYARLKKIPILALNAEKSAMRAMRGKKAEELTPEERAEMEKLDFSDPYQRAMVGAIYGGHAHGEMGLESFVRAQTVWDETMAETVADYLASPAGKEKHVLVLAGGHHIRYGFGIPRRAFRRFPASYVTIGGEEINVGPEKQDRMMDVTFPRFPMVPYDFLAFLAYEDLPKQAVRLGVSVEPAGGHGLTVESVVPGSNAQQAGVEKGDLLLALDGQPLTDPFDLIYAVKQKHAGDHSTLQLERKGEKRTVEVTFRPAP